MLLWHPKAEAGAPVLSGDTGQGTSSHHAAISLIFHRVFTQKWVI